jgi:hypothetical protein
MTTIQARRKLIVVILLCVAVAGAVIRHFAVPGSTTRDIGTLLMLLWIPIIGNVVAWLFGKLRRKAPAEPAAAFDEARPFQPQVLVELTLRPAQVPAEDISIAEGEHHCAFVIGNEGFSGKWKVPTGGSFRRGAAQSLQVEFLAPVAALPRFQSDVAFRMLVGDSFIGDGRVLEVLAGTGTKPAEIPPE